MFLSNPGSGCGFRHRDRSAQCGLPAHLGDRDVHPLRKDLATRPALPAVMFKARRLKALHDATPQKEDARK